MPGAGPGMSVTRRYGNWAREPLQFGAPVHLNLAVEIIVLGLRLLFFTELDDQKIGAAARSAKSPRFRFMLTTLFLFAGLHRFRLVQVVSVEVLGKWSCYLKSGPGNSGDNGFFSWQGGRSWR